MTDACFGRVRLVPGENGSRFPSCTSILIDDEQKVVIDPGAGAASLARFVDYARVDCVLNTHYHYDHISGNHLFPQARILTNPHEFDVLQSPRKVAERLGILEIYGTAGVEEWVGRISSPGSCQAPYTPAYRHEWWLSTGRVHGHYPYDDELWFGKTLVKMVYTPGHTAGYCCPHFPHEGLVYAGDIDLTSFGPWYCGSDGDIDAFLGSAKGLLRLDADVFVTGHQEGVLSRTEFEHRLDRFLDIIETREMRLAALLESEAGFSEVLEGGVVYPPRSLVDPWVRMWETISVKKHAERLAGKGHAAARIFLENHFGGPVQGTSEPTVP